MPAKRILPALRAICCASMRSSVDLLGLVLGVQVPDVDVVRLEFAKAGVEVGEQGLLRFGRRLGREGDVLADALQRGADHALAVARLVAAGGIEVADAEVGGAFDDARVRGDHAAEADRSHLQAGFSKSAIGKLGLFGFRLLERSRTEGQAWSGQPRSEKASTRGLLRHDVISCPRSYRGGRRSASTAFTAYRLARSWCGPWRPPSGCRRRGLPTAPAWASRLPGGASRWRWVLWLRRRPSPSPSPPGA